MISLLARNPTKRADGSDGVHDGTVVFWTDICLLCALGLFIISSVPRAAARFSRRSEWWKGHFLSKWNFALCVCLCVLPKHVFRILSYISRHLVGCILNYEDQYFCHGETSCHTRYPSTRAVSSCSFLSSGLFLALRDHTKLPRSTYRSTATLLRCPFIRGSIQGQRFQPPS